MIPDVFKALLILTQDILAILVFFAIKKIIILYFYNNKNIHKHDIYQMKKTNLVIFLKLVNLEPYIAIRMFYDVNLTVIFRNFPAFFSPQVRAKRLLN